jgi:FAD/FMN-containing dehydrogenase
MTTTTPRGPKETAYDEHIAPIMERLCQLCVRHGIPLHVGAALDGGLQITTHIPVPGNADAAADADWHARYDAVARVAARNSGSYHGEGPAGHMLDAVDLQNFADLMETLLGVRPRNAERKP